jgi:hypothetical protein
MKPPASRVLLSGALLFLLMACGRPAWWSAGEPRPLPTGLAAAPPPPGAQAGGLDAAYSSAASSAGAAGARCYKLYRFYPDGLALYAGLACFEEGQATGTEIERWFER